MNPTDKSNLFAFIGTTFASFLVCFIIILYYIVNANKRTFSFSLVIMLLVSDCLYSFVHFSRNIFILATNDSVMLSYKLCQLEGMLLVFSTLSSFMCTTSITYSLYRFLILNEKIYMLSAFRLYWRNNYLYPFIASFILLIAG